jgi:sugar/nucleoside kinase (ribokinase family)
MKKTSGRGANRTAKPLIVGTGLVALDIVISKVTAGPERHWAGGTCGNVLIALSYLGWNSQPVARLGKGKATKMLLEDMKRWKVSSRFIRVDDEGRTPIIVERIRRDATGNIRHSFSWRCTSCGYPYPGYKAELSAVADQIAGKVSSAKVFFFDRLSAGAIVLAKACAQAGGLVVFEPSGIGNPVLFRQAWELAHIVKYSHERLSELPDMEFAVSPRLQIETLGDAGLRYRKANSKGRVSDWISVKAFPVADVKDSAGAGDWCTAGLLSQVGTEGLQGFLKMSDEGVFKAVRYGQALAAWACQFEGPRGGMYAISRRAFSQQIEAITSGNVIPSDFADDPSKRASGESEGLCGACDPNAAHRNKRSG